MMDFFTTFLQFLWSGMKWILIVDSIIFVIFVIVFIVLYIRYKNSNEPLFIDEDDYDEF